MTIETRPGPGTVVSATVSETCVHFAHGITVFVYDVTRDQQRVTLV